MEALLLEAAGRTESVLAQPAPRVLQRALTDFNVEYRLVCLAVPKEAEGRAMMLHRLHANVLDVFNEEGVQIMSPHYEGDPEGAKVVASGHPFAAPSSSRRLGSGAAPGREPA